MAGIGRNPSTPGGTQVEPVRVSSLNKCTLLCLRPSLELFLTGNRVIWDGGFFDMDE